MIAQKRGHTPQAMKKELTCCPATFNQINSSSLHMFQMLAAKLPTSFYANPLWQQRKGREQRNRER